MLGVYKIVNQATFRIIYLYCQINFAFGFTISSSPNEGDRAIFST